MINSGTNSAHSKVSTRIIIPFLALLIGLLASLRLDAQFFNTGQDPFSMKWEQLETSHFKILYDEPFRSEALRLARLMESYRLPSSASLGVDPKPITIVVHNRSTTSNAMVPIAPRRLEFYPLPPQDGLSQEWFRQLAIHEYRHVAQMALFDQGITKGLGYIFGEQAGAALFGVMLPFWFIEGDATVMETALSLSGRGRQPDFYGPLRAQLLEQGPYSYEKAVFQSYRYPVPNRYELGYHLVGLGRQYYGPELWENAVTNAARRPWTLRPFNQSIKKQTGLGMAKFYRAMMDSLSSEWTSDAEGQSFDEFQSYPTSNAKVYTDYLHPYPYKDKGIVCLRKRLDDIPRFVLIDSTGKEEVLYTPGYIMDESIGFEGSLLVWTEYQSDVRWENRSYSEVWVYDIEKRKAERITRKTRYFSPSISKNGRRIVVSFTDSLNNHELHIIDGRTGRVLNRFRHPSNSQFINPKWAYNDSLIVFISASAQGKGVQILNPMLGTFKMLMPDTYTEINHVMVSDGGLFFSSGLGGVRNIFVMDLAWNYIWRLTNSKYGVRDPYFDVVDTLLYYSEYYFNGFKPKVVPMSLLAQAQVFDANAFSYQLADSLGAQENYNSKLEQDSFQYEISKYSRIGHSIHLHSWAPLAISASSQSVNPGFSVISQDILGTTFLEGGYSIDLNERTGQWYVDASYRSFYPVIDLRYSWGIRNSKYRDSHGNLQPFSWIESTFRAGVYVPLRFHRGKWLRWVQPAVHYSRIGLGDYNRLTNAGLDGWSSLGLFGDAPYTTTPGFIHTGLVHSLDYSLSVTNQMRTGFRDIRARWRQSITLTYRHSPWGERTFGSIKGFNSSFYFPGLMKQHSLRVGLGMQVKKGGNSLYSFSYLVPTPRGVQGLSEDSLRYLSFSYAFPLCYPDLNLGPVAYIKRIRADLYSGFAAGGQGKPWTYYNSFGADLVFDGHLLRFVAPVEYGLRATYLPEDRSWLFNLIFQINFNDI